MNELTVYDLKQILNNVLDTLEGVSDEALVKVQPNTYGLYDEFLSIPGKGFINLSDPIEGNEEEEDY